ncbi:MULTISPECIES: methyl-accepting chemotaxis protein [Pseudomonas]|uniref:Methyl-accepting chemotaxis protein n=1 Tax=Serpens gallinarum TaxID=2763075 RepID=A0ABR8TLL8_9PSED|nr:MULTISPECIES: methyl-accepting chemotaxis protein [Pseudomonas]MBD7976348.1 methyl-accepting chemotaxis protein [Serpens gallinarum]MBF0675742.1 methyl-accepting chemotaxis protein [Pseudomonas sp.]
MFLRRFKVGPRAFISFSLVALLVVLLGLFAQSQMKVIRGATLVLLDNTLPSYVSLGSVSEKMLRLRIMSFRLLVDREEDKLKASLARADELVGELSAEIGGYERLISNDAERVQFSELKRAMNDYVGIHQRLVQFSHQNDLQQMHALLGGDYNRLSIALGAQLNKLVKMNSEAAADFTELSRAEYQRAEIGVMIFLIIAALLTVGLALIFTRSIVAPLGEAVRVAETVAAGDLTQDIRVSGEDEPARLLAALRTMQQSLKATIQGIGDSSNQLASAAEELNAVTENSSKILHQQNHEIEQAATAVNEMTAAVDEVARNAVATSEASRGSDTVARKGQEQVNRTVDSIHHVANDVTSTGGQVEQLAERIRHISTVLDVIRSIAEQTNLLALNAAIEAARAGDAGRGFAVVADEVRALAHRTQQSTQEIEQMVAGIQQGTDQAVAAMQTSNDRAHSTLDIARAAGEALEQITAAIGNITERNLIIASASEEQAQVAREVDRNLVNIRDLAVQTSAGAHQTNSASQELARLAVQLKGLVMRFKV